MSVGGESTTTHLLNLHNPLQQSVNICPIPTDRGSLDPSPLFGFVGIQLSRDTMQS